MKIGKATVPRTAICTSDEHTIVVRGTRPLEGADRQGLVRRALLPAAHRPHADAPARRRCSNATLVAIAEHGLVPSVQAARMTFAAAPDAMQGAVAAGMLGCGSVVLGSSGDRRPDVQRDRRQGAGRHGARRAAALEVMQAWRAAGKSIPGYGHPLHKERDERVGALFDGRPRTPAPTCASSPSPRRPRRCCPRCLARRPRSSTSRARSPRCCSAPASRSQALKGVPILARTAGLIAHLVRGDRASRSASRCRTRRRARWNTTATSRPASAATRERPRMIKVLAGITVVEQGTFITGPAGRHAARRPRRRRRSRSSCRSPAIRSAPSRAASTARTTRPTTATSAASRSTPRAPADREVLDALIAEADVYIQNFRPGVAEKLGVGEQRLRALNPRLVYCSISGFGADRPGGATGRPTTPWRRRRAASSSLLVNPENPRVVGPAIADSLTGFYAAYGVLGRAGRARPHRRRPHGRGVDARGDGALQPRRLHRTTSRPTR